MLVKPLLLIVLVSKATSNNAPRSRDQRCSCNQRPGLQGGSLFDLIHKDPNLVYTNLFLSSNCFSSMGLSSEQAQNQKQSQSQNQQQTRQSRQKRMLGQNQSSRQQSQSRQQYGQQSQQRGKGMTIFAPNNEAWISTFNMSNFTGFNNCSGKSQSTTTCLEFFGQQQDFSQLSPNDLGDCLSIFAAYYVSPQSFIIQNSTLNSSHNQPSGAMADAGTASQNENSTILDTLLSSSWLGPNYASNFISFLALNTTSNGTEVRGGGNSTAKIVGHYDASDGELYIIDNMLIPPLPLNYTLALFNRQLQAELNSTNATALFDNTTGSVFLPMSLLSQSNSSQQDLDSSLIYVPDIYYQNQSSLANHTLNTKAPLSIQMQDNHIALVNGASPIELPNIPLSNGVLHLLATNSTASNGTQMPNRGKAQGGSSSTSSGSANPNHRLYANQPVTTGQP